MTQPKPRRIFTRGAAAGSALVLLVAGSTATADTDHAMWRRYADFQRQQASRWFLSKLVTSLSGWLGLGAVPKTVDRLVRHQIRLTTGKINPTNTPVFGEDFEGRRPLLDAQIGFTQHGAATGQGVVVAVLDSGFNLRHPAIRDSVLPFGFDPVGQDWDPQDRGNGADDDGDGSVDTGVGHGTFVAGMVLLAAPEARILPVRIADDEGLGLEGELVSGIDFAIAMGADVINLSYEAGTLTLAVRNKLQEAHANGITVVVSAGNDGSEEMKTMAESGTTISVGAVGYDDRVAPFSNAPADGRGLTLFAPGVTIWGPHGGPSDTTNCTWSGTSFAAPFASGAAALVLESSPGLTPLQVRDRLRAASIAPVIRGDGTTYPSTKRIDLREVVD